MCDEYEGFSNYFTACVDEFLKDDRELFNYAVGMAERSGGPSCVGDVLKAYVEDMNPLQEHRVCGRKVFYAQLLQVALDWVDWTQLGQAWIERADEQKKYRVKT